jgi:hypothetical protein
MYTQSRMLLIAGGLLTAVATAVPFAVAQTRDTQSDSELVRLASRYSAFAGSDANARALVTGLREDTTVALAPTGTDQTGATFDPATGKLGFGNINIALSLAQKELGTLGITQPSPTQIRAALNGGTIQTTSGSQTLPGVLTLRSQGMGWGQIANSLGFKLGDVVSASHTDRSRAGAERPDKPEKAEKAERPDKPDRAARADRPDHPQRPAR